MSNQTETDMGRYLSTVLVGMDPLQRRAVDHVIARQQWCATVHPGRLQHAVRQELAILLTPRQGLATHQFFSSPGLLVRPHAAEKPALGHCCVKFQSYSELAGPRHPSHQVRRSFRSQPGSLRAPTPPRPRCPPRSWNTTPGHTSKTRLGPRSSNNTLTCWALRVEFARGFLLQPCYRSHYVVLTGFAGFAIPPWYALHTKTNKRVFHDNI